jgi:hypothetical protein
VTKRLVAANLLALVVLGLVAIGSRIGPPHPYLVVGQLIETSTGRPFCESVGGLSEVHLTFHPEFGTATQDERPMTWPPGFTARLVGSEVHVHDATGELVAETGKSYAIRAGESLKTALNFGLGGVRWVGDPIPAHADFVWVCEAPKAQL